MSEDAKDDTLQRAREAQERLIHLLREIGQALPLFVFIKNDDLTFEYWSPRLAEWSGIQHDDLFRREGSSVFPQEHLAGYQRCDIEVLETNKVVAVDEPLLTVRGERWIHTQKFPIAGADVRPGHILGIAEDITERVRSASERGRLFDEVSRAVAERDRALAAAAHDLANPLAVLSLAVPAMLGASAPTETSLMRAAARAARATQWMHAIVSDLRTHALLRAGRLTLDLRPSAPRAMVVEAVELEGALAESRGVRLGIDVLADVPPILCDSVKIGRVLTNLLVNAIKFTPTGGAVTSSARAVPGAVWFEVADSGPGIAPEDVAHLFEPYWRAAKASAEGTGLGLSIAKGIVDAHGGTIGVRSNPGCGASFFFTLPRAER
jgi:PAS domain S-box-containing protein